MACAPGSSVVSVFGLGQFLDARPHGVGDGNDAEAADAQQVPAGEGGVGLEVGERNGLGELFLWLEIDDDEFLIALVGVGVGVGDDLGDADGGALVAGVIDQ